MKKINFLKSFLSLILLLSLGSAQVVWGQTTINFDTSENWTLDGSGYGSHSYSESGLLLNLTNGLRNTSAAQDGFPGALGTYSIRLQNNSSAQALFTIASGGVGEFSFQVRRWDDSPMPDYTVEYSVNNGTDWVPLANIDGTLLTNSDWKTYGPVSIDSANPDIQIRIRNTGTTERIMIDDFMWTENTGAPNQTATPSITASGTENGTDTYWNTADVSITTSTPDATIYYTTDGSSPTTSSPVYSDSFAITTTTTIKAMATSAGLDDSNIATKEFTITTPSTATIPYSQSFDNTLGDWISYTNNGVNWIPDSDGASVNGYNSQSELVWLISPEFLLTDADGMLLSFDHTSDFTNGNDLEIRYSTDYAGYGNPENATWTTVSTVAPESSGSVINLAITTSENVHIALVYTDVSSPYAQWSVSNLFIDAFSSDPVISVNPQTVPDFATVVGGTIDTEEITVTGINLEGDITVTLSDDTNFAISNTSFTETDGTLNEVLTISYDPATAGTHTATVTLSSTNATDVVLDLNGTATISAPTATDATDINSSGFTANWNAVPGAESYETDIYTLEEGGEASDLFISVYIEGAPGNRKAIQIFNGTSETITLDDVYTLKLATNGGDWGGTPIQLTGSVNSGGVFVIAYGSDGGYPTDQISTSLSYNGDDAVGLFKDDVLIDIFGVQGEDPGSGWTMNGVTNATKDHIITRNSNIAAPNVTWDESEWTVGIEYANADADADAQAALSSHTFDGGSTIVYVDGYEGLNVGNVTSYEVTGLDSETTYYYVVRAIADGNTTANSNEVEVTTTTVPEGVIWTMDNEWSNGTGPTIDDDVIILGDLVTTSDFSAKTITVENGGSLIISANNTVTVDGAVINNATAQDFVVNNNANLIQNIDDPNMNEGNITVIRQNQPFKRLDYTLWSSPVSGQQIQAFSPETLPERIYTYEGTNEYVVVDNPSGNFENGKGYLFRAPNNWNEDTPETYTGQFIGVPFNGTIETPAYAGSFTSIGNPYASNLDADLLMTDNSGISTLYFWTNTNPAEDGSYTANNYATYTFMGGTGTSGAENDESNAPTGIISVGQGFIVETTDNSVEFTNAMRSSEDASFFKTTDVERHRFWLELSGADESGYNQILIGYMDGATEGIDHQIDGKMFGYQGNAIFSHVDNENFTIQGRPLPFADTDVVPLGFRAVESNTFTISLINYDGLFTDGDAVIYLKDNLLNLTHNLMDSGYTFQSDAGEFNDRFEIVYQEDGTMGNQDLTAGSIMIYTHDKEIVIDSKSEKLKSVEIYDLQGRRIHSNLSVHANIYNFTPASKGIWVVKAQTESGKTITKKVMK